MFLLRLCFCTLEKEISKRRHLLLTSKSTMAQSTGNFSLPIVAREYVEQEQITSNLSDPPPPYENLPTATAGPSGSLPARIEEVLRQIDSIISLSRNIYSLQPRVTGTVWSKMSHSHHLQLIDELSQCQEKLRDAKNTAMSEMLFRSANNSHNRRMSRDTGNNFREENPIEVEDPFLTAAFPASHLNGVQAARIADRGNLAETEGLVHNSVVPISYSTSLQARNHVRTMNGARSQHIPSHTALSGHQSRATHIESNLDTISEEGYSLRPESMHH